jgi:hypothetical protein
MTVTKQARNCAESSAQRSADLRKFRVFSHVFASDRTGLQMTQNGRRMFENKGFFGLLAKPPPASTEPKVAGSSPARCIAL